MSLEAKLTSQLNQHIMKLNNGPREYCDPLGKVGLHPTMWKIRNEIDAGNRATLELRRIAMQKKIAEDFHRQNDELKVFCKCFGST